MKKYTIIFFAAIVCLHILSCKKNYLDEKVYSSYAPQTLSDSLGLEAQMVGLQNQVTNWFTYSDNAGWCAVWAVGTDIAWTVPGRQGGFESPYNDYATLTSTDGAAAYAWKWAYSTINNANNIIKYTDQALPGMTANNRNSVGAEARFFRAYAYNILATLYGGVPVITQPLATAKTDFVRASLDSVNALVVRDLTFAVNRLPDIESVKSNSKGKLYARPNKYMASQLLAEVYLRTGQNALAEQQCQLVISSGKFSLVNSRYGIKASQPGDPFSDMFMYGNERRAQGNKEALWVIEVENPNTVIGGVTNSPQQRRVWGAAYQEIAGTIICDSLGGRSNARLRLSNYVLYGLYPANDMRNSKYNIRRRFYYNDPASANYGKPIPYVGTDTLYRIAPHTTKWYQFDPNDSFGFAMIKDFIVMRLGETYLLQAEAQFKQGNVAAAANSINALRTRANAPQVTATQITLDFILDERARELLAEENRRMTLMRTSTLVTRATAHNSDHITGLTNKNLLLPIPQTDIDLNKDAKLTQNPGY